ncbi:MAG: class I SAM-dependent methyltransferase [Tagaea sp.]|nr:class I SAM-dependent methyltransferase [Tagaea sp.]
MSLATVDSSRQAQPRQRAANDWYVEPEWAVLGLLDVQRFSGLVWDPACGKGTIPRAFKAAGHRALGTDLIDRGFGAGGCDFTAIDPSEPGNRVDNVVSNPPFDKAEAFLRMALACARHKVALLLRLSWLEGRGRRWVFDTTPLTAIHPFASRVSMPPGSVAQEAKGGAVAFMWAVWDWSHPVGAPPILRRIERKPG